MRFGIAAVMALLAIGGPAAAEQFTAEQLFFASFYRGITSTSASKNIPDDVSQKFAYCMTKVIVGFVSEETKAKLESDYAAKKESSAEVEASLYQQIVGGLTPSLALGKDVLGEYCPEDAAAYRKYLKG